MDTIDGMRTFIAVVSAGSFTAAAEHLNMSTALVSKYVGQLEERLGVRLLNRTTRSLVLTEIGQAYLERCAQVIDDFDELEAAIHNKRSNPSGNLIISAPVTFGERHMTVALARFLEQYPDIVVDLRLTDRFVGLVDEAVDLAIRIAELPDSSLIARRLAPARVVACAAPSYLEKHGLPCQPEELVDHVCIIDNNFRSAHEWPFMVGGERMTVKVSGRFSVNSAQSSRAMVLAGAGIGLVPTYAIGEDIKQGQAVVLLEPFEALNLGIYAVYLHNRHLAAKVRAFIDFMAEEFGTLPPWDRF
jgi:DNA-binding transcriptional LysR family regulator